MTGIWKNSDSLVIFFIVYAIDSLVIFFQLVLYCSFSLLLGVYLYALPFLKPLQNYEQTLPGTARKNIQSQEKGLLLQSKLQTDNCLKPQKVLRQKVPIHTKS